MPQIYANERGSLILPLRSKPLRCLGKPVELHAPVAERSARKSASRFSLVLIRVDSRNSRPRFPDLRLSAKICGEKF